MSNLWRLSFAQVAHPSRWQHNTWMLLPLSDNPTFTHSRAAIFRATFSTWKHFGFFCFHTTGHGLEIKHSNRERSGPFPLLDGCSEGLVNCTMMMSIRPSWLWRISIQSFQKLVIPKSIVGVTLYKMTNAGIKKRHLYFLSTQSHLGLIYFNSIV